MMENTGYKDIEVLINSLSAARKHLLDLCPNDHDMVPEDHDSQITILTIQLTCYNAINQLLKFCDKEWKEKKHTAIIHISDQLHDNFTVDYPQNLPVKSIKNIDGILSDLTSYIQAQSRYDAVMFTDEDEYLIKHFVKPKPGDQNIEFFNKKTELLKKILPILPSSITPENASTFLKHDLYKNLDEFTLTCAIDELTTLLKISFFDVDVKTNTSWMRSISFLNQLKNIMREALRMFRDIEKLSIDKGSDISSDHLSSQEKKSNNIPSLQKQSPRAPMDDLSKEERKKPRRNDPIVVDHSLIPKENKTIEQYLKEADQDFAVGGFKFLSRAKERYERILKMFP